MSCKHFDELHKKICKFTDLCLFSKLKIFSKFTDLCLLSKLKKFMLPLNVQ